MPEWLLKQRYNSADVKQLFKHAANIIQNFPIQTNKLKFNNQSVKPTHETAGEVLDNIKLRA
jgi:hypothetical protein